MRGGEAHARDDLGGEVVHPDAFRADHRLGGDVVVVVLVELADQMVEPPGLAEQLLDALAAAGADVVGDHHRRREHDDRSEFVPDVVP
ncbi:DUF3459 domain-containing protein [Actinomadura fulvescens]|uniref:DUF3459 domain-containing protein n=1 Tax=Actinomadura fulvescens TaxID=46160 RepID=UPI003CD07AED